MIDLKIVKSILSRHYKLEDNPTYIFGSRANNCNRIDSDLDILIDDRTITPEIVELLHEDFEDSELLYKVDIVLKTRIDESFYDKIFDDLIKI